MSIDDFQQQAMHFEKCLFQAEALPLPQGLRNFEEVENIREFLLPERPARLSSQMLDGKQINRLVNQIRTANVRGNRLYAKLLGRLLKFQEEIRNEKA